jgi:hypothetical protein
MRDASNTRDADIDDCAAVEMDQHDPHGQLRALYLALLTHQERFDEFKHWLSLYPVDVADMAEEPDAAAAVRGRLNQRISAWIGAPFGGLNATQMLLWRAIVVDERFTIALSPWRESNLY